MTQETKLLKYPINHIKRFSRAILEYASSLTDAWHKPAAAGLVVAHLIEDRTCPPESVVSVSMVCNLPINTSMVHTYLL